MLIGHGGENHRGAYLADTIIIASFDPKEGAVTMLSIPRDLYIKYETWGFGRINGLFENSYYNAQQDIETAAQTMMKKLTQLTSIPISYYAIINFQWFEQLVDSLWWVSIDVPSTLIDSTYPKDEYTVMTIKFEKGFQTMDGSQALQYTRSRHSTSDFSRSYRQQQVIQAIVKKLTSFSNITYPSTISQLYSTFTNYIHTNISLSEMLSLAQYIYRPRDVFSFVYSSDCMASTYELVEPGCLLYSPDRKQFGGAAVLLPLGASYPTIEYYDVMKDFAQMVIYHQSRLKEKPNIEIRNAIDKKNIWSTYNVNGLTNRLASKLRSYGFNIPYITTSQEKVNQTTIIIHTDYPYNHTLQMLDRFMPTSLVLRQAYDGTGYDGKIDMTILLGPDYLTSGAGDADDFHKSF